MKKIVCPWTGGADTSYLVYYLLKIGYEVYPYHIDYGNMNAPSELWAISNLIPIFNRIKKRGTLGNLQHMIFYIPHYKSKWVTGEDATIHTKGVEKTFQDDYDVVCYGWDVPFRNAILFSMGVAYAESIDVDEVSLAVEYDPHSHVEYRDDSWEFAKKFNELCKMSTNVTISCPITDIGVTERYLSMYEIEAHKFIDVGRCNYPIRNTISGHWESCGKCSTCVSSRYILEREYGQDYER